MKKVIPFKGVLFALLFALCQSISNILIKKSSNLIGSEHSTIRYFVQIIFMSSIIKCKNLNFPLFDSNTNLLVLRGLIGSLSVICGIFALTYLHPSNVSAINNLSVFTTTVLARFLLEEKITPYHLISSIFSLIGITLIIKPKFLFSINEDYLKVYLGTTLALLSSIFIGSTQVLVKKLTNSKVHYSIVSIYPCFFGIPASLCISYMNKKSIKSQNFDDLKYDLVYSLLAGVSGSLSLVFLSKALEKEDASKVAIVKNTDVLFSFVLQFIFLNIKIDLLNLIGSIMIIMSTIGISVINLMDKNQVKFKNKLVNVLL